MNIFKIYKQNAHFHIEIFGLKIKFRNTLVNHIEDCCFIYDLDKYLKKGVGFVHPIGIVITKGVELGNNCVIFHNVTIGKWRGKVPKIGNNVKVFPNSVIIGDIEIGDNCIIGAGSVVTKSIPANKIAVGNPARVVGDIKGKEDYWIHPEKYDRAITSCEKEIQ